MRKKREQEPVPFEDSGWQAEGEHAPCGDGHQGRLIVALDFDNGYRNVYACRKCQATRVVSGPGSATGG